MSCLLVQDGGSDTLWRGIFGLAVNQDIITMVRWWSMWLAVIVIVCTCKLDWDFASLYQEFHLFDLEHDRALSTLAQFLCYRLMYQSSVCEWPVYPSCKCDRPV